MILYHGSTVKVEKPLLTRCRINTDFGRGFYTTTSKEQAMKWARLKQQRDKNLHAVISVYEVDEQSFETENGLKILRFNGADNEWLNFVFANRRGLPVQQYDVVFGPVANDRLFATISLYEQGILSAAAAIEQLKTYLLFDQISFHTQETIDLLKFVEFENL